MKHEYLDSLEILQAKWNASKIFHIDMHIFIHVINPLDIVNRHIWIADN